MPLALYSISSMAAFFLAAARAFGGRPLRLGAGAADAAGWAVFLDEDGPAPAVPRWAPAIVEA